MDLSKRLSRLEAKAMQHAPSSDLFERMKRYEALFEAIEAGLPLDTNNTAAKECLGYQKYFDSQEAQG